jgi:hypothetical protein
MIFYLGVAAIVVGVVIGAGSMLVARRTAATSEQAIRRQRIVLYSLLTAIAVLLAFDAVDTPRHRYLNIAILAFIPVALAFDWARARRRENGPSEPRRAAKKELRG